MRNRPSIWIPLILLGSIVALTIAIPAFSYRNRLGQIWNPNRIPAVPSSAPKPGANLLPNTGSNGLVVLPAPADCTYNGYYFSLHPGLWPTSLAVGKINFSREQARALFQAGTGDAIQHLAYQAYVATLNIQRGASHASIDQTLTEAYNWLSAHPPGTTLSNFEISLAQSLDQNLTDYNTGNLSPGACPGQPALPPATATKTLQPAPSAVPSPTLLPPPPAVTETSSQQNPAPIPQTARPTSTVPPSQAVPPTASATFPSTTSPTATSTLPPTSTQAATSTPSLPAIVTISPTPQPPATSTPTQPPTSTAAPPTPFVPTDTSLPPTSTPVPASSTPLPPTPQPATDTPIPSSPTASPVPPSSTPTTPEPGVTPKSPAKF